MIVTTLEREREREREKEGEREGERERGREEGREGGKVGRGTHFKGVSTERVFICISISHAIVVQLK